ncbi:MAG: MBG domain-containing protein, partial [Planctomycetaceae bacterium]
MTKAALTVTPTAGQSKLYGAGDPTFLYGVSGLVNSDTAATAITAGALGRAAGETVAGGSYSYSLGSLASGNYSVSLGGANTFAITKAALTVTPTAGQSKLDGAGDPTFLYGVSGLVNSDTAATAITGGALARIAGENVSGDPYRYSLGSLTSGNYSLSLEGSDTFDITPVTIAGSFTAADKSLDGSTAATVTGRFLTGVLGLDVVSFTGGTATFDTAAAGNNKVVTLTGATLTGTDSGNYTLSPATSWTTTAAITTVAINFPERSSGTVATVDTGSLPFAGTYSFQVVGGADSSFFSVNSSGQLILNSPLNFEVPTDADANGIYQVNVQVTSTTDLVGTNLSFVIIITDVNDPMRITSPLTKTGAPPRVWTEDSGAGAFDPRILLGDEDAVQTPVDNGRIWMWIGGGASGDRLNVSSDTNAAVYRVRLEGVDRLDQVWVRDGVGVAGNLVLLGTTVKDASFESNTVDLRLTAEATLPLVQKFLRNVTFDNPTGGPDYNRRVSINLKIYDSEGGRNDVYLSPLEIVAQPDAPVITSAQASPTLYTENASAIPVDGTLWLTDPDRPASWAGYVVTATLDNPQPGDLLSVAGAVDKAVAGSDGTISDGNGNQIGSYEVLAGGTQVKLTMTGGGAARLLRLINFRSTSENPNDTTTREIKIVVDDGVLTASQSAFVNVKRVNDAPVIALGGGTQTFNEDAAAVNVLTGSATVSDVDDANFNGGRLTVAIVNTANALATLGIRNVGTSPGANQIGLDGANLLWGSDVIGTVSIRPESLAVTFTSNLATAEVVAAVASNVTLFTSRQAAPAAPFQLRFTVSDGELSSPAVDTLVAFAASNDAVQLTGPTAAVSYTEGIGAVRLGVSMTMADPDLPAAGSLGGRLVTVSLANATLQDSLGILNQGTAAGQINVSGNDLFAGNIAIGTILSNSQVGNNLVLQIQLQAGCTQTFLTSLLRYVVLVNTNPNPSTVSRTVTWTVDDDPSFGSSSFDTRVAIVAVNSAPSVITSTEAQLPWAQYSENGAVVIVDSGFSISDVDLNSVNSSFNGGTLRVRVSQGTSSDRLQ